MKRLLPILLSVLFSVLYFHHGIRPMPESADGFNLDAFAHLPVMYEGRKKPMDTLARNLLTVLSGRQTVRSGEERLSAVEWFCYTVAERPGSLDYPVFRIENRDVLATLGLEERKGFRYTYRELLPKLDALEAAARAAYGKEARLRDLYDRQVIQTAEKLYRYRNITTAFENPSTLPQQQLMPTAQYYMQLEKQSLPLAVPPSAGSDRWRPLMSALLAAHPAMQRSVDRHGMTPDPLAVHLGIVLAACRAGDAGVFNRHLDDYAALLREEHPSALHKLDFEVFYNRFDAFMKSAGLYLLVFVLGLFGWLIRNGILLRTARSLMVCAFIPHTFGIVARIFLSGYPPVTNLYSSAIFIGWAAVAAGIILETVFRRRAAGIGCLVGSIAGFTTLLIAHFLAGDGDTMEQLRAVLDTRFWLATHVITISLGYMATFISGTIGLFYILVGVLSRRLDAETRDELYRMMYGTTCFALLLSFVGTVLGGLWADDSWGRFWGWDPKENGALMIVIWNAVMLHARLGRMIGSRGFAVSAVTGNIVTAWSWFGVNQLSVGLHSYGFTQSASFWLLLFVLSQLAVVLLGLIPPRRWRSGQKPAA